MNRQATLQLTQSASPLPVAHAICFVGILAAAELIATALQQGAVLLHGTSNAGEKSQRMVYYTLLQIHSGRRCTGWAALDARELGSKLPLSLQTVCGEVAGEFYLLDDLCPADLGIQRESVLEGLPMAQAGELQQRPRNQENVLEIMPSVLAANKSAASKASHQFLGTSILLEVRRASQWVNESMATC